MEAITAVMIAIIGSGVLNTIVSHFFYSREKKKSEYVNIQKALRLMMKNELKELCGQYIEKGHIYEDELEDLIAMHNVYHDTLGGNGFLDTLINKVENLEIRNQR